MMCSEEDFCEVFFIIITWFLYLNLASESEVSEFNFQEQEIWEEKEHGRKKSTDHMSISKKVQLVWKSVFNAVLILSCNSYSDFIHASNFRPLILVQWSSTMLRSEISEYQDQHQVQEELFSYLF